MKCTVCNHPQLHDIDQALLAENATFAALSQKYGLSISALFRHKRMLKNKMALAEERLQHIRNQEILFQYNDFLESTRQIVRTTSADGDTRQALRGIREGTRILNFITKLEVKFDPDTVYRILASPQWVSQDSLLPTDPTIITGTRQTLADDLFFPCPEIPPDPQLDAWDEEGAATADLAQFSYLETQNVELETLHAWMASEDPPAAPSANRQLATAKHPKIQREISAKLAPNIFPAPSIIKEKQTDNRCKKNNRKTPGPAAHQSSPQPVEPRNPDRETGHRPPDPDGPPHQTQPSVAPDPFLQAFPYLVCKTSSQKLPRPQSTPIPATTISPEHLPQSFPEGNHLKNNSASGELTTDSRPAPPPEPVAEVLYLHNPRQHVY
jgi:hypothetical protein